MDKFRQSLPMMLHRTLDSVVPLYRAVFREHGISEQQWRILRVLWENDECTTAELAKQSLLPSPSMVGIIDRMEVKALVTRTRNPQDRRQVFVRLTKKGRNLQNHLSPKVDQLYAQIMNDCDPKSWQITLDTLEKIIKSNKQTTV